MAGSAATRRCSAPRWRACTGSRTPSCGSIRSPARAATVPAVNDDTLRTADVWRTRGDTVALATVVRTRRSAPRPLGSKFAISSRGDMAGSVSGGCVEGAVYSEAQEVLGGAPPKLLYYGIADD